jgi:hypothetical protein
MQQAHVCHLGSDAQGLCQAVAHAVGAEGLGGLTKVVERLQVGTATSE